MSNYSFTQGLSNKPYQQGATARNLDNAPATPNQIDTYVNMCLEKKVKPADTKKLTRKQANEAIQALTRFYPASDKQKDIVRDVQKQLYDIGVLENMMSEARISRLSGGKQGTASKYINDLFELQREHSDKMPLNDYQKERLVEMYLCPDVPFENMEIIKERGEEWYATYDGVEQATKDEMTETVCINRTITVSEEFRSFNWSKHINGEESVEIKQSSVKRNMTPSEFVAELESKVSYKLATYILDQYQDVYYQWARTRATDDQIEQYRRLERRMYTLDKPKQRTEEYTDITGEDRYDGLAIARTSDRPIRTENYEETPITQLKQMSRQEMTQLLRQMNYESRQKEVIGTGQEVVEVDNRQDFDAIVRKFRNEKRLIRSNWRYGKGVIEAYVDTTSEELREAKSKREWEVREYTKLNDLMYALEAIAGYEYDEIHDVVKQLMLGSNETETVIAKPELIRNFMMSLINDGSTDFNTLSDMIKDCETAQQILMGTY